jgi:hypothetical protein
MLAPTLNATVYKFKNPSKKNDENSREIKEEAQQ